MKDGEPDVIYLVLLPGYDAGLDPWKDLFQSLTRRSLFRRSDAPCVFWSGPDGVVENMASVDI